jgi:hypothetical protein
MNLVILRTSDRILPFIESTFTAGLLQTRCTLDAVAKRDFDFKIANRVACFGKQFRRHDPSGLRITEPANAH